METKFDTSKKVRKELEEHMEMMRKVLEDKEKEIKDAKDQLRQAKEAVIHEYCDFNALLEELRTSYTDSFDDVVRQAKKAYPVLDFSMLNIDDQAQATAQPVSSDSMEGLFTDKANGEGESAPPQGQAQTVKGETCQPMVVDEIKKDDDPQKE